MAYTEAACTIKVVTVLLWIGVLIKDGQGEGMCQDITGNIGQPSDISCVFKGRRDLICQFNKTLGLDYHCSVNGHTGYPDTCCENENYGSPIVKGECQFNCRDKTVCTEHEKHMLKISWMFEGNKYDLCHIANTAKLVKPGMVQNVVIYPNTTAIRVKFKKPDDYDNKDYKYNYYMNCSCGVDISVSEKVRTRRKKIKMTCSHLKPGRKCKIQIVVKPNRNHGFPSDEVVKETSTLEDVPVTGARIPAGRYSVVSPSQVIFYPSEIPSFERNGKIINQSVDVRDCFDVTFSQNLTWILVNLSSCETDRNITINTFAETKIGWSTPSTMNFDPHEIGVPEISSVHKDGRILRWTAETSHPVVNTVHMCYGQHDEDFPQLVKCKTKVVSKNVNNTSDHEIPKLAPVKVACDNCEWRYAVSSLIGNTTTSMVWDTPNNANNLIPVVGEERNNMVFIITVLIVSLVLVAVATLLCYLKKKNLICRDLEINMPEFKENYYLQAEKYDESGKLTENSIRDSGNGSMEEDHEESELSKLLSKHEPQGHESPKLEPLLKDKEVCDSQENNFDSSKLSCMAPLEESIGNPCIGDPPQQRSRDVWDCSSDSMLSIYRQCAASVTSGKSSKLGTCMSSALKEPSSALKEPSLTHTFKEPSSVHTFKEPSSAHTFKDLSLTIGVEDLKNGLLSFPHLGSRILARRHSVGSCTPNVFNLISHDHGLGEQTNRAVLRTFPKYRSLPAGLGNFMTHDVPSGLRVSNNEDSISKSASSYSFVDLANDAV